MRTLAPLSLVLLAACATQQPLPVLTPEIAQQMSAAELCLGLSTFRPGNVPPAQTEIARRGINCQDHAQGMQLLMQQRLQRQQAAQSMLPAYTPLQIPKVEYTPVMPSRPSVTCTTERVLNQLQTVCR
jgi:hypothetical protein